MAFAELAEKYCTQCNLSKNCHTPEMPPTGPMDSLVYVLGEWPNDRDDLIGKPFSGQVGEVLKTILDLEIDSNKVRFNNSVNCRSVDNKNIFTDEGPSDLQINACRDRIISDIKKVNPKIIIAMGNAPLKTLFGRSEPGIFGWRGWQVPSHELNCWVVPTFPMKTILRDGISDNSFQWIKGTNHTDTLRVLREDLSVIPGLLNIPIPKIKPYKIQKLLKFDEIKSFFIYAWKQPFFMFDFETLGLKPYFDNSYILTCAFSFDGDTAYAMPVSYFDRTTKKKYWNEEQEKFILNNLSQLLIKEDSRKGIHNSVFEMEWSKAILGINIQNIEDSMLQKYILDCREGTMKMDFLTFMNFGISHKVYPDSIMSDLTQLSIDELLDYNGKDTIFEYRIFKKQEKQMSKDKVLQEVYKEQLETARTIAQIQFDGACTSEESRNKLLIEYKNIRESLEKELLNLPSIIEFKKRFGKVPTLKSNSKDIPTILFKIEELEPFKKTKKENFSVDKEVLNTYSDKSKFCELLLKYREYSGLEGKILKSWTENVFPDQKYHTNFYPIETGRLGCIAKGTKIQAVCDRSQFPEGKNIEDIQEGDFVYTFDENMNLKLKKVLKSWKTGDKEIIRIHWINNSRNGKKNKRFGFLDCTPEHLIKLYNGVYIEAKDLKIGTSILSLSNSNKKYVSLYGIEYLNKKASVYDIEVDDTHNFIANELCVHNSSRPNLQNLDKRKHPEIRQIIIAPEGSVLLIFDQAQLEARVLAALSNCRKLIDAIKIGYDIHLEKAIEIWGEEVIKNATEKEVKAMRYRAKNEFVFPSFYGSKPKATAKRLDISESKAEQLLQKLWADFPEILEWQQGILKIYDKKRYVEIPPGRRRYAPLTTNEILNSPIQGCSASIVSKMMNILSRKGLWVMMNVHDELVFCVKEKEAKEIAKEIQFVMESKQYAFMGDTPLKVEGMIGLDWFNIVKIEEVL